VLLATVLAIGCVRNEAAPARSASLSDQDMDQQRVDPGPSSFEAEIGGLSQEDVDEQFQALRPRLLDCVHRASSQMSYLGGRVSLRMRVDRSGNVRWAYLNDSTLGDRDTELCVLDIVKSRTWPLPLSGEGLAETSFDVEPAEPPASLPAYKSSWLAQRATVATRQCRKGIAGAFTATAYIGPDGELLSVGIAPPNEKGEEASDCVVDALRALRIGRLAAPDHPASKVSFRIR